MPNLTIGAPVVASLRKHSEAFFDCHLMVSHPQQWIKVSTHTAHSTHETCLLVQLVHVLNSTLVFLRSMVQSCIADACCGCRCSLSPLQLSPLLPAAACCLLLLQDFAKAGAGGAGMMFTFHLEAASDPAQLSRDTAHPAVVELAGQVRQAGMKVLLPGPQGDS